jgi:hypothetical protein
MSRPYGSSISYMSAPGQVVTGIGLVAIIFIVMFACEILYKTAYESGSRTQILLRDTASSDDSSLVIHQNKNIYQDAKPITFSMNERSGIEFSYSFYIFVKPPTFDGHATFKHVFHKGYGFPWPLMGPGVFFKGDENTMRVIMNTYMQPFEYADIDNFPVQKWVHVVLNCYKNGLDIYINGNVADRISFSDTLPYQNFQDLVMFSTVNTSILGQGGIPTAISSEQFPISGSFTGYLSRFKYARYALSINEIQTLMNAGPSTKMSSRIMENSQYLADDWWVTSQGNQR